MNMPKLLSMVATIASDWSGAFGIVSPSTSVFSSASTPAREISQLSWFVLTVTLGIFVVMTCLIVYALVRFRAKPGDPVEPPQVYGSIQIELAWTVIPILLLVVLFLGSARILFSIQDARKPASAINVIVIGHQFWWEFHYPQFNVVTANELHIPLSNPNAPIPTFMTLTSADVMHSFWVPQLAGKTDLLPNRVNQMWIDPQRPGLYEGQCAQFCGVEHAKMLLRIYVDQPEQFQRWIADQQRKQSELPDATTVNGAGIPGQAADPLPNLRSTSYIPLAHPLDRAQAIDPIVGQYVFEHQACINCHTVNGTVANGRFGPDLTHVMSRDTLAAGVVTNNPANLKAWITDPNQFKPGCLMPAMHLTDRQNAQITAYLLTLK
jgi:cytochrome c oxidase subunit II